MHPSLRLNSGGPLDAECHPLGGQLQEPHVIATELPRLHAADVNHTQDAILHRNQWDTRKGAKSLLTDIPIHELVVGNLIEDDWLSLVRDPSREPGPDCHASLTADLRSKPTAARA
jgi:hypothetical protein